MKLVKFRSLRLKIITLRLVLYSLQAFGISLVALSCQEKKSNYILIKFNCVDKPV